MTEVKLYIYDISQGLAKSLSPMFLGKQIDGIWHTSIVVFGHEYFFGSDGIQFCLPSGTVLGEPLEVHNLGRTEMPKEVLDELLADLSRDRFHGSRYNLLRHNCNNFSDELAQFLTGQGIPARITGLPAEVLSTPFGAQLEQMLSSMQMQLTHTQGYHYSNSTAANSGPTTAGGGGAAGPGSGSGSGQVPQSQTQPQSQLPSPIKFANPPADFADDTGPDDVADSGEDAELCWLDALNEAEICADSSRRLTSLLRRTATSGDSSRPSPLAAPAAADRFVSTLEQLLARSDRQPAFAELAGRVAVNSASDLLAGGVSADRLANCARRLLASGGRAGLPEVGGALALNLLLLRPGNESLAFDLGCLLTDRLQAMAASGASEAAQLTLARALCAAARSADQLAPLAAIQGLSLDKLAGLCPHVARLNQAVVRAKAN
ncbi:hypothetical protein BOX15_Mlig012558g1 [Macrostomum lignano]|uniref:PPPDE domain-containing protein n=1 Tax=Macrostomum lignano TaxID=282301 RepID=A0A267FBX7_9PLAT|nr:hypothetical protein BOX15_Mlig012558g1 [Macrostomum lignano]